MDTITKITFAIIPIIATVIMTYFMNIRKEERFRFLDKVRKNLDGAISPMYHEMYQIRKSVDSIQYEHRLNAFFNKYTSDSSVVSYLGEYYCIRLFYELNELYIEYQVQKSDESWKKFNYRFEDFFNTIKEMYFSYLKVDSKDMYWNRRNHSKSLFFRVYYESLRIAFDLFSFIVVGMLVAIYFYFSFKISGDVDLSYIDKNLLLIKYAYALIFTTFGILWAMNGVYLLSKKYEGDSFIRKVLKKTAPQFEEWLREAPFFEYKKFKLKYEKPCRKKRRRLTRPLP